MSARPFAFTLVSFVTIAAVSADGFQQNNLVTDNQAAHPAQITDPSLVNPWGMSFSGIGPFWVSNNGSGNSTVYSVNPGTDATSKLGLAPAIPGAGNVTGQVYGGGAGFNSNQFLFVSEDGTISGWRAALGGNAEVLQTADLNNVYKGAGWSSISGHSYLYSANFHTGNIDILKGDAGAPDLSGRFTDPNLPVGFAPFNIQNLAGTMYVTFAMQDVNGRDEVAGAGLGIVDAFDLQGNLIRRVASNGGALNAPWGLAIAPGSWGSIAGKLLVGNFGDGSINVYDAGTSTFIEQLTDPNGNPLVIDGLWGLLPGNNGSGGSPDRLYFTAGPDGETHGLFGSLTPVPEPASLTVLTLGGLALFRRRRK